jgi:hypothetical protein
VILNRHLNVNLAVRDRPQIVELKGRRLRVEDQFGLRCIPSMTIESAEFIADTAGKPDPVGRAIAGWQRDQRLALFIFCIVIAVAKRLQRDGISGACSTKSGWRNGFLL